MSSTIRRRASNALQRWLLKTGHPRVQMSVIVIVTGGAGFLISWAALQLGLDRMGIRYLLAVLGAYAVFLGLLRLWAEFLRRHVEQSGLPEIERTDATEVAEPKPRHELDRDRGWGWLDCLDIPGNVIGGVLEADEGCLLLVPLAALLAMVIAAFSIISTAPVLLAEVLFDVVIVSLLYRRLRNLHREHWLAGAVRRTWVPAIMLSIGLCLAGMLMQWAVPGAKSVGGFVEKMMEEP